uniref:selection and upkeep of intraepithelial T-cells protein 6-like n=1 Tax=Semicossyphus pulcher TaxID=241346 RepID=UPI0037E9AEDA
MWGQSLVVEPLQQVVAAVGEDIVLPCHLGPTVDATELTVEWRRPDLNPRFVYVWRDGVELGSQKHPAYVGRTSVSINKLKHGDISLILHKVKVSDKGTYECFVPTLKREAVELVVGAVSSLIISFRKMETDGDIRRLVLQCESEGWYPEPEVLWLDGEGNHLSAGPTETVRGPDDLYTVSSRLTVENSNSFTCRVQQKDINQTRETHLHVPGHKLISSKTTLSHNTDNIELKLLNEEKSESLQDTAESTKIKDLDEKEANLVVQLKQVEDKHRDVLGAVHLLMEYKKDIDNEICDLKKQLNEVKRQMDEKQHQPPSQEMKEQKNGNKKKYSEENQTEAETKTKLHNVKEELKEKLQHTETRLKSMIFSVAIVTEKKEALCNDKEEMNAQLEDIKTQRDDLTKKPQSDNSVTYIQKVAD